MTEEQIKEALSRDFIHAVAHVRGVKCLHPDPDHGVDVTLCPVIRQNRGDRVRLLDSPHKLDLQIKSTTVARVMQGEGILKFDLEVKTYNDLVNRRQDLLPLYLVLVIFDVNPPDCLFIDEVKLSILGRAYWYLPDEDAQETGNDETIRISIPVANRVDNDFVTTIYGLSDITL